jgi:hypothetical protein
MPKIHRFVAAITLVCMASAAVSQECSIPDANKVLDPVEVGFCESDAVFVARIDGRLETVRAFRPEGSERTMHYLTERSTARVLKTFKGKVPDKLTMVADLYDKKSGAYSFRRDNEYLVFAKRLPGEDEYAGATAACSVQPTLLIAEAAEVLSRLEQHRKGAKKIDCDKIQSKEGG